MSKLTRESVLAAAMARLTQYGLGGLSMRGIAGDLGVQPGALYWHFENKQRLLAACSDALLASLSASSVADPVVAALELREAASAVPDGAELLASTIAFGLGGAAAVEHLETALVGTGHDPRLAATLLHLVLGHVMHEQQRAQAEALGVAVGDAMVTVDADSLQYGLQQLLATHCGR